MTASERPWISDARGYLQQHVPWLLEPDLGVCVVGTAALAEACRRNQVADPPRPGDLDLAWRLDVETGQALLDRHGALRPTTENSRGRGTLALQAGPERIEITTFRTEDVSATKPLIEVLDEDLRARDMTVGAVAWILADDVVHDPVGGLDDWRAARLRAVGDPAERVAEHPARWLRYYRKAHEWGFRLDSKIRHLPAPGPELADAIPTEVVAAELRKALLDLDSPGTLLQELAEAGLLQVLVPELAPQFDGRPAGPVRHHPEISQALHLVLTLEWAAEHTRSLPENDRLQVLLAALLHDLGKGDTEQGAYPGHRGHEQSGRKHVTGLFDRLPGLGDTSARRLADAVCALHLEARDLRSLRPGTIASRFDEFFRDRSLRIDLFALAVAADSGGRRGRSDEGHEVAERVRRDLELVIEACRSVDAADLRKRHPDDLEAFRAVLHEARARAVRQALAS